MEKKQLNSASTSPLKEREKYLNYLFPNFWHDRCLFIKRRSEIKLCTRKGETDLKMPKIEKNSQIDLECPPNSLVSFIELLGSKCKYCNLYRVIHLVKKNNSTFLINSVYSNWKESKKKM